MTRTTHSPTQVSSAGLVCEVDPDDRTPAWSAIAWLDGGYVPARFGGEPVLVAPELAAEIRAAKAKR